MSSTLKKLFKTPDAVSKLTAKDYYEGFKKIFSKVGESETPEDEDSDESVPAGEPFFYVADFTFADGEAPLLWVGALSNEWKIFRKAHQNKSSFAKGYAERASEENPDPESAAFTFTVTDGKALKETIFKIVERTVKKYCSKTINVTLPTVAQDNSQPTQPEVSKAPAPSNYVQEIFSTFNLYKNTDGMKAPAAKIKLRFELEALIENWDEEKKDPEDVKKINELSKALKEGLQWKEQLEDLAFSAKNIAANWNKCLKALGGNVDGAGNVQDFKEQRKRYMELRMVMSELSDWSKKENFYFQDERDANTLPTAAANQLMQMKSSLAQVKEPCQKALALLIKDNPNANRLEQAYRDFSPKDDIRVKMLGIEPANLDGCDKSVKEALADYKKFVEKISSNPNIHAYELSSKLTALSDKLFRHKDTMPEALAKEIGAKIYEAKRELGLSGYLDDSAYKNLCELFDTFSLRAQDYENKWQKLTSTEEEELDKKRFAIYQIQTAINAFQREQAYWEKQVSKSEKTGNIETQQKLKHVRKMYFDINNWASNHKDFKGMKSFGKALPSYELAKDPKYKADALQKQREASDLFMKDAIHVPKIVSIDGIKGILKISKKTDLSAKPDVVQARIKKLREELADITTWLVNAKKYSPGEELSKAKEHFQALEALKYEEINELTTIEKSLEINTRTVKNQASLEKLNNVQAQTKEELRKLKANKKPSEKDLKAIQRKEKKILVQNIRKNNLQNSIAQGGRILQLHENNLLEFTETERQELSALLDRWKKAANTQEAEQIKQEVAQKLQNHDLEAAQASDLEKILATDGFKNTTFKASVEKSNEAIKKASSDLELDYNQLANQLTTIVQNYNDQQPDTTLAELKELESEIIFKLPDGDNIKQSGEVLGLDYYPKLDNLRWHCQRLQNEIKDADTLDKKMATTALKEAAIALSLPTDGEEFLTKATDVLTTIRNWQKRNNPPKDSKEIWTLPSNKDTHDSLEQFKNELIEKLKKSPLLDGSKPNFSGPIADINQEIEELRRGIRETLAHPTVKQWDEQLKGYQTELQKLQKTPNDPQVGGQLETIQTAIGKIRVDYYNIEDDMYRAEEERTFAPFKGEFDIFKNRGFQVPDNEQPILQKTYERIINRVNARIKNGESPDAIRASLAHIPFNFIPDKCIADLAAWQATRKAVLEKHFESKQKITNAEMYSNIKLNKIPKESIQEVKQKAAGFVESEEMKQLVVDLSGKTPEELDQYIKEQEEKTANLLKGPNLLKQGAAATINISLLCAKALKQLVDLANLPSEGIGFGRDIAAASVVAQTGQKLKDATDQVDSAKGFLKSATDVATILGGVSSILQGILDVAEIFQSNPKTNPQTAFDKFMKKGLKSLQGVLNIGIGVTAIVSVFQSIANEALLGLGLAADLVSLTQAIYSHIQHSISKKKTKNLRDLAENEVNPLALAFQQEIDSIDKKIAQDRLDIVTSAMSATGNVMQLAGIADPSGGTIAAGKIISWTSKGVALAGKLVLTVKNIASLRKAGRLIKKAAAGDREAQIKVMSHSSYYAKMFIALKAYEGDPLAKKYLIDRNMSSTDLDNDFTSKSVLQEALLFASEETDDTFWYDPVSGDFTSIGKAAFEDFIKSASEVAELVGAKVRMFFGKTPTQNYQQLETLGLISKEGLHQLFANYVKFKSKKLGAKHPHRARLANSFASSLKVLYAPLSQYHQTLQKNISDAQNSATTSQELNQATKIIETIETEAKETARLLQLFELHELNK